MRSVDVIVPCYRYGHFLKQCVDSVLTQPGVDVRVLIIDDASPDNSAEVAADIARQDGRVTFLRHVANKGHIATYNEGIEWTSGDYLLLLSADDYLLPGALGRAADLMQEQPDVSFTFGNASLLFDDGQSKPIHPLGHMPESSPHRVMSGTEFITYSGANNIVPTASAIVRTDMQKRVGGYRRELPHSGDMEMWLRLAATGSVGFVNAPQAVYRIHASNMSQAYMSNMLPDLQQRKAALDWFFAESGPTLSNADQIRNQVYQDFGRAALKRASVAFNDGLLELSEQIKQYALSVSPDVRNSWPWAKLACKQALGFRRWHALQSVQQTVNRWRFQ